MKLHRNVVVTGIVSFFNDVSSEMILPILPLFLTAVLGANMAVVGLVFGLSEATASIIKIFSGYWSDKIGKRRPFMLFGYSLSALTKPLFALSYVWPHVLIVKFLDRFGKGIRDAPRDALIAESAKLRGTAFGFHRMMDTLGAVVGTLIASYLLWRLSGDYRRIFWLSFIPAAIGVFAIFLIKEIKKKRVIKKIKFSFKTFSPNYKRFIFVAAFFHLASFSYAFFILRAQNLGIAIALIPIVYLLYNVVYAALALPAGEVSDKIGKKPVLVVGFLIFALTCFGFAYVSSVVLVWILFALYGVHMAFVMGVARAFAVDLGPANKKGTAIGIYHTLTGLAVFPASLIVGFLWNNISVESAFIYAGVVSLIAAAALGVFVKEK